MFTTLLDRSIPLSRQRLLKSLNSLEHELGVRLFHSTTASVCIPTRYGHAFYAYATQQERELCSLTQEFKGSDIGEHNFIIYRTECCPSFLQIFQRQQRTGLFGSLRWPSLEVWHRLGPSPSAERSGTRLRRTLRCLCEKDSLTLLGAFLASVIRTSGHRANETGNVSWTRFF